MYRSLLFIQAIISLQQKVNEKAAQSTASLMSLFPLALSLAEGAEGKLGWDARLRINRKWVSVQLGSAWATPCSQPADFLKSTGWRHFSNSPGFLYDFMLKSEGDQDSRLLHVPRIFPSPWKRALSTVTVLFCHLPGGKECGKTASSAFPPLAFIKEESKILLIICEKFSE